MTLPIDWQTVEYTIMFRLLTGATSEPKKHKARKEKWKPGRKNGSPQMCKYVRGVDAPSHVMHACSGSINNLQRSSSCLHGHRRRSSLSQLDSVPSRLVCGVVAYNIHMHSWKPICNVSNKIDALVMCLGEG